MHSASEQHPEWVTIPKAARIKGVGEKWLRSRTKTGELACSMVGAWPRVRLDDVEALLRAQRVEPPQGARDHVDAIVGEWIAKDRGT